VLGRLTAEVGERLDEPLLGVTRLFPRARDLARRPLPMPRSRARTIAALDGAGAGDLEELPGIGPWTAGYVRMRLGDPDVLLTTDLVIRRALAARDPAAAEWRPFRSYATHQLWASAA
jgi:AraC family transcriptional regulator of adaptative response / DNA-3-methyladenine glycosylase II